METGLSLSQAPACQNGSGSPGPDAAAVGGEPFLALVRGEGSECGIDPGGPGGPGTLALDPLPDQPLGPAPPSVRRESVAQRREVPDARVVRHGEFEPVE